MIVKFYFEGEKDHFYEKEIDSNEAAVMLQTSSIAIIDGPIPEMERYLYTIVGSVFSLTAKKQRLLVTIKKKEQIENKSDFFI